MASTTITENFVKQYGGTLDLLLQIRGGKFKGKCLEDSITGEERYYDQLGSVTANEVTDRYGDSPENDITHDRRRVVATPYDVGLMLDRFDKVQMLVDPESEYTQQQISALMRKSDIEFIKGALGTAYSGKAGGTANTLGAANTVANGNTGMTLDKILQAKKILENSNVDLSDPMNKPCIAITPNQMYNLLKVTEVTSADYNSVKALVNGDVNTFAGFEFISSNLIPYADDSTSYGVNLNWNSATDAPIDADGNDIRACFAFTKSAVRQVTNPNIQTEVERRGDKRFNWYSYACLRTGAVRMEEEKVVIIGCDETID